MKTLQYLFITITFFILPGCQTTGDTISSESLFSIFDDSVDEVNKYISSNELEKAVKVYSEKKDDFKSQRGVLAKNNLISALKKQGEKLVTQLNTNSFTSLKEDHANLSELYNFLKKYNVIFVDLGILEELNSFENSYDNAEKKISTLIATDLDIFIKQNKPPLYGSHEVYYRSFHVNNSSDDLSYEQRRQIRLGLRSKKDFEKTEETAKVDVIRKTISLYCSDLEDIGIWGYLKCLKAGAEKVNHNRKKDIYKSPLRFLLDYEKGIRYLEMKVDEKAKREIFASYGYKNLEAKILYQQPSEKFFSKDNPDLIAIFVNPRAPEESITESEKKSSYLSGVRQVVNQDYQKNELSYQNAVMAKQNCVQQYLVSRLSNPYAINLCGFHDISIAAIQNQLSETPMYLDQNIYQSYSYSITHSGVKRVYDVIAISKNINGNYDFSRYEVPLSETFRFQKGLHDKDRYDSPNTFNTNKDVQDFLDKKPSKETLLSEIKLNSIIAESKLPVFIGTTAPLNTVKREKSHNLSNSKYNDVLDNSIALIKTRSGIGSGFYIQKNYILTNNHVVSDNPLIKVSKRSGKSASGIVIHRDSDLDLAIIAVPDLEGVPLLLSNTTPNIGENVIAYGHPRGFEYSVTKGVISSIRLIKHQQGALPKNVEYIQSDVAISPGNSGGPLIQNSKVVGVATWKRVDRGSEGLSFSVSSKEVIKWVDSIGIRGE